jgi:hypothetical protein|tara:strand:- start:1504 stop:1929 length:426 start_codon:yes stop_codon:yes gene_type:complete
MKKAELKKLLKPMIKECIKEVIFEEGVLSNIVSEVATGLGRPTLVESKQPAVEESTSFDKGLLERQAAATSQRNKLLSAINKDAYGGVDIFEGTEPLTSGGSPSSGPRAQGPLSDMDPSDPGVDITGILGVAGDRWSRHMK